jgi:hypothetical protein
MYDFLLETDLLVQDADKVLAILIDRVGLAKPHPNWLQEVPEEGYRAYFCRVHPSLGLSPTRLEVIAPILSSPDAPAARSLQTVRRLQRHRPSSTHATVLVTRRFEEIVDRVESGNVPHLLERRDSGRPFDRLTFGTREGYAWDYDSSVDGGLFIKVLSVDGLVLPGVVFEGQQPRVPEDLSDGAMVRVTSRVYLVEDLDATLRALEANACWAPVGPVHVAANGKRAVMGLGLGNSGTVELIQPGTDDECGRVVFESYGPGSHDICIAVNGLQARAEQLRALGTEFSELPETDQHPRRLRVELPELGGAALQFWDINEQDE